MTKQEIDFRRAIEDERHNRAQERLTESGQEIEKRGQIIKSVADVVGRAIGKKWTPGAKVVYRSGDRNDAAWWNTSGLQSAGARINTDYPLATTLHLANIGPYLGVKQTSVSLIPFMPTIGGREQQKYFNYTLDHLFQILRQDNTASPAYTKSDPGKLLLAFDSIYMLIEHIKLVLRIATAYSEGNRLHARGLLAGLSTQGGNNASLTVMSSVDSWILPIIPELPAIRARLNTLIDTVNKWAIPNSFPFMINHIWMVSRIFADGGLKRDEWYMFIPYGYYKYDPLGKLVDYPIAGPGTRLSLLTYVNSVLSAIGDCYKQISEADFAQLVTGDFMKPKAFGTQDSHYVRLPKFGEPDSEPIDVSYDPEALYRIKNIRVVPLHTIVNVSGVTNNFIPYQMQIIDTGSELRSGFGANLSTRTDLLNFTYVGGYSQDVMMSGYGLYVTYAGGSAQQSTTAISTPTTVSINTVESFNLLMCEDGQASEDDILVDTRGMYTLRPGCANYSFELSSAPGTTIYECVNGAFIYDYGTELYGQPVVVSMTNEHDKFAVATAGPFDQRIKNSQFFASSMSTTLDGAIMLQFGNKFGVMYHYFGGCSLSSPGYAGNPLCHASGVTESLSTTSGIQPLGEYENCIPLPDNNVMWCHNAALASAFTSPFLKEIGVTVKR